jgi:membrane-bound serine protease (ClpP class)
MGPFRLPSRMRTGLFALVAAILVSASARAAEQAVLLDVNGAIGPATADYVVRELRDIDPAETRLVILRINTPGGLDASMRAIIAAILASPTPVAAYVAPSGARAASAGTYIVYACAVAAMAPGANIGAATPVQLIGGASSNPSNANGAPQDPETRKIVNDAAAYIRGLAELNGRNADWAEQAVRSAASIPAAEALKLHVVDVVADSVPDLLRQIDGRQVVVAGKPRRLDTTGLVLVERQPDWRTDFLSVITDPDIAFLLLLLGVAGLAFEFSAPGAVLPGAVGAISLLAALLALDLLPIDYAGAALALLGVGLIAAEIHIGAFGALGVAGLIALAMSGLIMFPAAPGFSLSRPLLGLTIAVGAGLIVLLASFLRRTRRLPAAAGAEALVGAEGEALGWEQNEGRVRVQGEIWRARAAKPLQAGARIRVVGRQGLVLTVEPF